MCFGQPCGQADLLHMCHALGMLANGTLCVVVMPSQSLTQRLCTAHCQSSDGACERIKGLSQTIAFTLALLELFTGILLGIIWAICLIS